MNGEKVPLHDLSDRELLLLTAQKVNEIPALTKRVDDLESDRDKQSGFIKAIVAVGGVLWALLGAAFSIHVANGK